jgi:hypothetical protein
MHSSYGEIEIMNNGKNERVVMELKKKGWFSSGGNEVYGTVYDADNKARYRIEGKWTESLSAYPVDDAGQPIKEKGFLVWKMNPLPAKSQQQFKFTSVRSDFVALLLHLLNNSFSSQWA